jgi:AbrB family looped-hinge helix DNA binding protein
MAEGEPTRIGKRGTIVIPARLRRQYQMEEGSMIVAEATEGGILLRPAAVLPVEIYTPERVVELLAANAVTAEDREAVRAGRGGAAPAPRRKKKPASRRK